jgi:hypothetical protein
MKIYIDGVLAASLAITGTITVNNNILSLGSQPGFNEFYGGSVDEVRIWNIARTQSQIQADMNRELDPVTQTGLVSAYTMNQGIAAGNNTGLTTIIDQKANNNGIATTFDLTAATSNFVTQKSDLLVLPVSWLSFIAQRDGKSVILKWSTGSEQGTDNYLVQHSTNGTSWNSVATLNAAGNSIAQLHYYYKHATPAAGYNYYRIVQKDLNNRVTYSKTVTLLFREQRIPVIVFPNPVSDGNLNIQLQETAIISIYNNTGVLIWSKKLPAGAQPLDISKWANGIYYMKAAQQILKIVVQ